ncbi:MAG: FHA domain-containing protein [Gammaproteobacteria bacterium]|nr:FHA domain-containing protein [Gammaproteobacteria bacterium]
MLHPLDIKYYLSWKGERKELAASITIGRHLENDLVFAGEDVLDYHLRIEATNRGPRVYPLGEASLTLNGAHKEEPVSLIIGDILEVGQNALAITAEFDELPEADEWWLYGSDDNTTYKLTGEMSVGRDNHSDIFIPDDHISRGHARFRTETKVVWLQDLDSANGTYVNGERLVGGCRLFHGDEVAFDAIRFQLVGKGADLTPVRKHESSPNQPLIKDMPRGPLDTTEISVVNPDDRALIVPADTAATGAFFLGASDPVNGLVFRIGIGRTTIGRDENCDIVVKDLTVSIRHAEIVRRPEGCTISNLMATNGTRVNDRQVQNAELCDGDVLCLGQVRLIFKNVPVSKPDRGVLRYVRWVMLAGSLVLAGLVVWLLLD